MAVRFIFNDLQSRYLLLLSVFLDFIELFNSINCRLFAVIAAKKAIIELQGFPRICYDLNVKI